MTVAEALRDASARIGVEWARSDAEMLMAHALGISRSAMLIGAMRDPVPEGFAALLDRRLADEPVAYILGSAEFFGRNFIVTPEVLIPRADSECVVDAALEAWAGPGAGTGADTGAGTGRILDCGTGSGALLLTLLAERPASEGVGIDRSLGALAVAAANMARLGLNERARMLRANWRHDGWHATLGRFDLVIANPPYVEQGAALDPSVRDFEPAGALFAGPDGLDDYHLLVPQLPDLLNPGGVAVLEIGASQAASVTGIAQSAGFSTQLRHDLAGRPRALILR